MPSKPTLEDQLRGFLEWQDEARREHKTVEAVYDAVKRVEKKQDQMMVALERNTNDRLVDKQELAQHGRAIKGLQKGLEDVSDAMEGVPNWRASKSEIVSGHHDIESIKKQIADREKEERDEATWWRRQRWLWFGIAITALFGVLASGCLAYTMKRIDALEKTLQQHPEHTSSR